MYTKRSEATIQVVRITDPGEEEFYSDLLTRRHYLGSSQYKQGRTIVHVARRGRDDIAIVTWEASTRHWFGKRDKLIGWSKGQKGQRLQYCIENRRFLMLEEGPNLASQVLAQSVARLSADAQAVYRHDVLLAETFVDPNHGYDGTCYRAAGWIDAGLTSGGHGRETWAKKLYFVKELKQDALAKLRAPELSPSDTTNPRQTVLFFEQLDLVSLKARLEKVPEYRKFVVRYELVTLLALIVAAVLAGAKDAKAIHRWVASLSAEFLGSLGFRRAPSHTTLWRVITNVGQAALQEALCGWLAEQSSKLHVAKGFRHLVLDGKTLRAASKNHTSQLHVVTLIDAVSKTLLRQELTDEKSNEIPKAVEIFEQAPIDAETIITADALHTQVKTAEAILKKTVITSSQSKTISSICAAPS